MDKVSQQVFDLFIEAAFADAEKSKPTRKGNYLMCEPFFLVCSYEDAHGKEKASE